jgi:hypothetical protein
MRFSMLLVGLSAMAAVACGGSDDNDGGGGAGKAGSGTAGTGSGSGGTGSGNVDSGSPEGTPANELTDAQVQAFCDSVGKATEAAIGADAQAATCGFSAYFVATLSGGDAAACQMAYDECASAPPDTTSEECTKPSDTCTATVGEIEACLSDSLAQMKQLLAALPGCDDLGKDVGEPSLESESPASCAVVQEKCPEALDNVPDSSAMDGG